MTGEEFLFAPLFKAGQLSRELLLEGTDCPFAHSLT